MLITILAGMIVASANGALVTSFNPHCSLWWCSYSPHFTDGKIEAPQG